MLRCVMSFTTTSWGQTDGLTTVFGGSQPTLYW